jgi:hypothetical protein
MLQCRTKKHKRVSPCLQPQRKAIAEVKFFLWSRNEASEFCRPCARQRQRRETERKAARGERGYLKECRHRSEDRCVVTLFPIRAESCASILNAKGLSHLRLRVGILGPAEVNGQLLPARTCLCRILT